MWLWGLWGVCSTRRLAGEEEGEFPPHGAPLVLLCSYFLLHLHLSEVDRQKSSAASSCHCGGCHCPSQVAAQPCLVCHCAMIWPETGFRFKPQAG